MRGWLIGKGMAPEDASRVTLHEYSEALAAERKQERTMWECTRWQTFIIGRWLGADINHETDLFTFHDETRHGQIPLDVLKKIAEQ